MVDPLKRFRLECAGTGPAKGLVGGDDLRGVYDRGLREACLSGCEENVSRHVGETDVRGEDDRDDRRKPTAVEGVGLNDEYRIDAASGGCGRVREVSLPDLAALLA